MTVHIDEMTTQVESTAQTAAAAATAREDRPAERERARRMAERNAQIVRRTRAEGYDD